MICQAYQYFEPLTPRKIRLAEEDIAAVFREIFKDKADIETSKHKNHLNMLHLLSKDLRSFLVGEAMDHEDRTVQISWLEVLLQRRLLEEFYSQLGVLFKEMKSSLKKNIDDCAKGLVLAQYYRRHVFSESQKPDAGVLQECIEVIDDLMEVMYWKNACDQLNALTLS